MKRVYVTYTPKVSWRSWLAHRSYEPRVAGSSPAGTKKNIFSHMSYNAFIIDLDGTIWNGDLPIKGAKDFVDKVTNDDKYSYVFLSNTGEKSSQDVSSKLYNLYGANVSNEKIVTAKDYMLSVLKTCNFSKVYIISPKWSEEFYSFLEFSINSEVSSNERNTCIAIFSDGNTPQCYVQTIARIAEFICAGAQIYISSLDKTVSSKNGRKFPGPGMMIDAALSLCGENHKSKITSFGKGHNDDIVEIAIRALKNQGCTSINRNIVIIGDRFDTDIRAGKRCGLSTILVESGSHNASQQHEFPYDTSNMVINSVEELSFRDIPVRSFDQIFLQIFDATYAFTREKVQKYTSKVKLPTYIDKLRTPRRIHSSPANLCELG